MPKYRIAILPGDGVGKDVVEATMIVLDKIGLDADYVVRRHRLGFLVPEKGTRCPTGP